MAVLPASAYGPCGRTHAVGNSSVRGAPRVNCGKRTGRAVRLVACCASTHLAVGSFNVLCPLYNQTSDGLEVTQPAVYTPRLREVAHEIVVMAADVVCLQEFWVWNAQVSEMVRAIVEPAGYTHMFLTPRPNRKADGLAVLVRAADYRVVDSRPILFNDCADRVAQLVHIEHTTDTGKQAIIVNTHLLFPYNSNSTIIQLRESMKILEFVEAYVTPRGLAGADGSVGLPIIICGDFNGTREGKVAQFLESQGFRSAYDSVGGEMCTADAATWVSHKHRDGSCVGVDFMWVLNPSFQVTRPLAADWKAAVFAMVMTHVWDDHGVTSNEDGYSFFSTSGETTVRCSWPNRPSTARAITREAFGHAVTELGLTGPGTIGLLDGEISACFESMDDDGNFVIDYDEFVKKLDIETFGQAYERIKAARVIREKGAWAFDRLVAVGTSAAARSAEWLDSNVVVREPATAASRVGAAEQATGEQAGEGVVSVTYELEVLRGTLPDAMAEGRWCENFTISDHAPLQCHFRFRA